MAGTFFHLWLANKAVGRLFPGGGEAVGGALAAGSLGPDLGFFPGGPKRFSDRAHVERSGDFLRSLRVRARGEVEEAFAAGWALHVCTDLVVHPWVEEKVKQRLGAGWRRSRADLWHMRLEWGLDCRLLSRDDLDFLWQAILHFPQRPGGGRLLAEVGEEFYGADAADQALARGEEAARRWVWRIPRILLLCHHAGSSRRRINPLVGRLLGGLASGLLGGGLGEWQRLKDPAALARPWHPGEGEYARALELGEQALEDCCRGWEDGFAALGNPDLTGAEVGGGANP